MVSRGLRDEREGGETEDIPRQIFVGEGCNCISCDSSGQLNAGVVGLVRLKDQKPRRRVQSRQITSDASYAFVSSCVGWIKQHQQVVERLHSFSISEAEV